MAEISYLTYPQKYIGIYTLEYDGIEDAIQTFSLFILVDTPTDTHHSHKTKDIHHNHLSA